MTGDSSVTTNDYRCTEYQRDKSTPHKNTCVPSLSILHTSVRACGRTYGKTKTGTIDANNAL